MSWCDGVKVGLVEIAAVSGEPECFFQESW